jgi:hypothetical protein
MTASNYQNRLIIDLQCIFGSDLVKKEWDSIEFDGHIANRKRVYAPRHDIAIGPFNSYANLDIGIDNTKGMQSHPFTRRLIKDVLQNRGTLKETWNSFSRCYLAIEIEFTGSSKHILGSLINASVSGSIGIVINNKRNSTKVDRIWRYLKRLEGLGRMRIYTLNNLIVFDDDEFLEFLSEFKHKLRDRITKQT